jgi:hypothetical protein
MCIHGVWFIAARLTGSDSDCDLLVDHSAESLALAMPGVRVTPAVYT